MAQQLRALTALAEDLNLVPRAHIWASQPPVNSAPGDAAPSSAFKCPPLLGTLTPTQPHTRNQTKHNFVGLVYRIKTRQHNQWADKSKDSFMQVQNRPDLEKCRFSHTESAIPP